MREAGRISGLIGVVHLAPMPGDPLADEDASFARVLDLACADARALADGGVDGLIVENFGSAPFSKGTRADPAPPHQVACLALATRECARLTSLPVGVNCLRNDARAALGIAAACDAAFVRVNVHVGAYVTDQGLIEGEAADTLRYRDALAARHVLVLADVLVKHAVPVAPLDPASATQDLVTRGLADGVIVTGRATGLPADVELVRTVVQAAGGAPVYVGSGLSTATAREVAPLVDGAIVGTTLKRGSEVRAPVDSARVRALADACAGLWRRA